MFGPCQGSGAQLTAGTPAGRTCRVKIELAALSGTGFALPQRQRRFSVPCPAQAGASPPQRLCNGGTAGSAR